MVDRLSISLEQERHRLTIEALNDVEAGRVVDHQTVRAWACSLDSDNPVAVPAWHTREDR